MTKLIGFLTAAIATAAVVGSSAGAATSTTDCHTTYKLRAHGLSCAAAKSSLQSGSKGFHCRTISHSSRPPFTEQCTKTGKPHVSFTYQTNGG